MSNAYSVSVAIVDYGMGNLFSVRQACEQAGLEVVFASSSQEIMAADAVILPGVGAFGDAIDTLTRLDLVSSLRDIAASPTPLVGICLGMQLMMTESQEFGAHRGLGIIEGEVLRLEAPMDPAKALKIPQVGWNQIWAVDSGGDSEGPATTATSWKAPQFHGLPNGEYMYFVHSYYAKPVDPALVVSTTEFGELKFCSSLRSGNVFACQFHPERSGTAGLGIYKKMAEMITTQKLEHINA